MKKSFVKERGFTLIEIIVTVGILALLAGVVLVAVNPARQFALARNTQRVSNVNAVLNAIGQRIAENKGLFQTNCAAGIIPSAPARMASGAGNYDVATCLSPQYMPLIPFDPSASGAHFTSMTDYDTGYEVSQDANGRITVRASGAELSESISAVR